MYNPDADEMKRISNRWAIAFVGLGVCALFGNLAVACGFSVTGERLTRTLRNMAFESMVRFCVACQLVLYRTIYHFTF